MKETGRVATLFYKPRPFLQEKYIPYFMYITWHLYTLTDKRWCSRGIRIVDNERIGNFVTNSVSEHTGKLKIDSSSDI